jgi:carbamoyltransferase
MYVLGLNATFQDSAACLLRNGELVAAAEEERFTRIKHHKRATPFASHALPFHAISYCLSQAGIGLSDVAHVAYSYDPFLVIDEAARHPPFELPSDASGARAGPGYDPWGSIFLAGVTGCTAHAGG